LVFLKAFIKDLKAKLLDISKIALDNTARSQEKQAKNYNKNSKPFSFKAGNQVYFLNPATKVGLARGLAPHWNGPY